MCVDRSPMKRRSDPAERGSEMAVQKANRKATCIWRLARWVVVMVPAPPTPTVVFGSPNCGWLAVLNISQRNARDFCSENLNLRLMVVSRLKIAGPVKLLRPRVPQVKAGG